MHSFEQRQQKGEIMWRKYAYVQVVVAAIFFCFVTTVVAATDYKELGGVWENPQYGEGVWKLRIGADGSYESFAKLKASTSTFKGKCKVVEKWTDSEGCLCYKTILLSDTGEKSFCLMKISPSGKILEYVEDSKEYPRFFNSEVYTYRKLYRK